MESCRCHILCLESCPSPHGQEQVYNFTLQHFYISVDMYFSQTLSYSPKIERGKKKKSTASDGILRHLLRHVSTTFRSHNSEFLMHGCRNYSFHCTDKRVKFPIDAHKKRWYENTSQLSPTHRTKCNTTPQQVNSITLWYVHTWPIPCLAR